MIGRLKGILLEKQPPEILLDVQGVGYELLLPMTSFYDLPEIGKETTLFTHLVVREDAHLLFGLIMIGILLNYSLQRKYFHLFSFHLFSHQQSLF